MKDVITKLLKDMSLTWQPKYLYGEEECEGNCYLFLENLEKYFRKTI